MNILLIEDDVGAAGHIADGLKAMGHRVEVAVDGVAGLARGCDAEFDVLVVDRMLPGYDGLTVVRTLRTGGVRTPIIFLTALAGVADRVEGLKAGADDYLVKPFEVAELVARVDALARRPPLPAASTVLKAGALELDRLARKVLLGGEPLELTISEFGMLELLLINAGRPVTRAMMLEAVFGLESPAPAAIIEPHMSRLRAKLDRFGAAALIRTVRGVGYLLAT